ncbi:hypothetical protein ACU8OG_09580 [Rhizobium leguminosarum]
MKFKLKKRHTFAIGMLLGLLVFAVGREMWWAFSVQPWGVAVSKAVTAVGSLKWIDTTLATGLAAVAAAYFSVRAVHSQINQAERTEQRRNDAKRAAARAVLPLTLSKLCGYAKDSSEAMLTLRAVCVSGILPRTAALPQFPAIPDAAITDLKELIEYLDPGDRRTIAELIGDLQVQAARMLGIEADRRGISSVTLHNIETYVGDAAKIYARSSMLFDYARGKTDIIPTTISLRDSRTATHMVNIYDHDLEERLSRRIFQQINSDI